ncbi:hypothetical protein ACFX13_024489 [Malus domestica]
MFHLICLPMPYEVGDTLEVMSMFATAEHEKERLKYFVSPERRDDLDSIPIQSEGKDCSGGFRGFPLCSNAIRMAGTVGSAFENEEFLHLFVAFCSPQ